MAFTRYNPDTGDMVLGRLPGHQEPQESPELGTQELLTIAQQHLGKGSMASSSP